MGESSNETIVGSGAPSGCLRRPWTAAAIGVVILLSAYNTAVLAAFYGFDTTNGQDTSGQTLPTLDGMSVAHGAMVDPHRDLEQHAENVPNPLEVSTHAASTLVAAAIMDVASSASAMITSGSYALPEAGNGDGDDAADQPVIHEEPAATVGDVQQEEEDEVMRAMEAEEQIEVQYKIAEAEDNAERAFEKAEERGPDNQPAESSNLRGAAEKDDSKYSSALAAVKRVCPDCYQKNVKATMISSKDLMPRSSFDDCPAVSGTAIDFTLAIQTSSDRSYMVNEHCKRWDGPISIVVWGEDKTPVDAPNCKAGRTNIAYYYDADEPAYPVNKLRNMAIDAIHTSHYILTDVDFLVDAGLYQSLRRMAVSAETRDEFEAPDRAFSLPAFDLSTRMCTRNGKTYKCASFSEAPSNADELWSCQEAGRCNIFDFRSNLQGHSTSNIKHWWTMGADELYDIPCFKSNRYEPYLVLRKCASTPRFDERFRGYGKNKIQHIVHLRYANFKFRVLSNHFVVHFPHATSTARKQWGKAKDDMRQVNDMHYQYFLGQLQEEFYHKPRTLLCSSI